MSAMPAKTLTGAYSSGYNLSAKYSSLSIAATGTVAGATGAYGAYGYEQSGTAGGVGGAGVTVSFAASVSNAGTIIGGQGGYGGTSTYGTGSGGGGGAGGSGIQLAGGASLANSGTILGGGGGYGGDGYYGPAGGAGGAGGAAISLAAGASVTNNGVVTGGAGGYGGATAYSATAGGPAGSGGAGGAGIAAAGAAVIVTASSSALTGGAGGAGAYSGGYGGYGGIGGAAVSLASGGKFVNAGQATGGAGGVGGAGYYAGGGGPGGAGVLLSHGATLANSGAITGGAGGAGGYGYNGAGGYGGAGGAGVYVSGGGVVANTGAIRGGDGGSGGSSVTTGGSSGSYGPVGVAGDGIVLTGGGVVVNGGTSAGAALVYGYIGIDAMSGGAVTVTNFGTIQGTSGVSLAFASASDRLIVEAGAHFVGVAQGGGGALELAGGSGTISGLGGSGMVTGSAALNFGGFAAYVLDAGGAWTLAGYNRLGAGQSLALSGMVANTGTLAAAPGAIILLEGADIGGGELLTSGGIVRTGAGVNLFDGVGETFTNDAQVQVVNGTSLTIAGMVAGTGRMALSAATTRTELVVAAVGATLSGGGSILLGNSLNNEVDGVVGGTLTNVNDRIEGAGLITGQMTLDNEAHGSILGLGSAGLTLFTGAHTVVNAGLIEADGDVLTIRSGLDNGGRVCALKGTLVLEGAVSGTGLAIINGGTLEALSTFNERAEFIGGTGLLELAQSRTYGGSVFGFSKTGGTTLDLRDIGFVSANEATFSGTTSGGLLTVSDGAHTARIRLVGDFLGASFTAASDGHGGVLIVDPATVGPPSTHAFAAAAAGMAPASAGSVAAPTGLAGVGMASRLASPHTVVS
jgi:fibronectin-binding autotransporter adhesin